MSKARAPCLLDGDVNAAQPRPVHACESNQVAAGVNDRDVLRLFDLDGFLFGGGEHAPGVLEGKAHGVY